MAVEVAQAAWEQTTAAGGGAPTDGQGKKGASERPKIFIGEETKPEVLVCEGRDAAGGEGSCEGVEGHVLSRGGLVRQHGWM